MTMNQLVDTQLRLLLEQQCAEVFTRLYTGVLAAHHFTLIAFDFSEDEANKGNVAFKSSMGHRSRIEAFSRLLEHWDGGPPRFAPPGIDGDILRELAETAKREFQAGTGFVALVGDARASAYISNSERQDVANMLRTDLIPAWSAEP